MHFTSLKDPFPLCDLLLHFARLFVDVADGELFLRIFSFLLEQPGFREQRISKLRPVLSAFARSRIQAVALTAVKVICRFYDPDFQIPYRSLLKLISASSAKVIVSLFLKLPEIPLSRGFCRVISDATLHCPSACLLLLKYSSGSTEKAACVAERPRWMLLHSPVAFRLFLALFAMKDLRPRLIRNSGFPGFLNTWAKDAIGLASFGAIFSKMEIDQAILDDITASGFFANFLEGVQTITEPAILHECLVAIEAAARVGYAADLIKFAPWLSQMLTRRDEITVGAIAVFVVFSCHREFVRVLKRVELVQYFASLKARSGFRSQAQIFLENVNA
jgi:hypothetical protein